MRNTKVFSRMFKERNVIMCQSFKRFAVFSLLIISSLGICEKVKAQIVLADSQKNKCVIVAAPEQKISMRAAERLQSYIEDSIGKAPQIMTSSRIDSAKKGVTVIAIGTKGAFEDLDKYGVERDFEKVERDGFIIKTVSKKGKDCILALGKTEKGADNAIWRLMRELSVSGEKISVDAISIAESPFIKTREPILCDQWVRQGHKVGKHPPEIAKKYCISNWGEQRLRNYVDLIDSFGYNGIQVFDDWAMNTVLEGTTQEQWRDNLVAMCNQAHKNGQTVTLFVFGSSVEDPETGKCWTIREPVLINPKNGKGC